jgi:hypothetical protein
MKLYEWFLACMCHVCCTDQILQPLFEIILKYWITTKTLCLASQQASVTSLISVIHSYL